MALILSPDLVVRAQQLGPLITLLQLSAPVLED